MNVYVLGAGVSKAVGYPLGRELFDEIDEFVKGQGELIDRFDYKKDWSALLNWLKNNQNALIAGAYRAKLIEHLFTLMDLALKLEETSLLEILYASKADQVKIKQAEESHQILKKSIKDYSHYRTILLYAMEAYFQFRHENDSNEKDSGRWEPLELFGQELVKNDMVITFNYDSTLERVLWKQQKWSPKDGYGFTIDFQESPSDQSPVSLRDSQVEVLHLHGAVGWYKKPPFRPDFEPPTPAGAVSPQDIAPRVLEHRLSLDPAFLEHLEVTAVDTSLPEALPGNYQILIRPSFLKDYELDGSNDILIKIWRKAAEGLRRAQRVFIIGYSLPQEDSAALTLLLSNAERDRVTIVNSNRATKDRLERLLSTRLFGEKQSFESWLQTLPNGSR